MKLVVKTLKILFGLTLFIYGVCCMVIAPSFTPGYFDKDILRITELIMLYVSVHGISLIVWALKKEEPIHQFRIDVPDPTEN